MELRRPSLPQRPCPVCGDKLDPLRAAEVLAFEDQFVFLCSVDCRQTHRAGRPKVSSTAPARATSDPGTSDPGMSDSATSDALNAETLPAPSNGRSASSRAPRPPEIVVQPTHSEAPVRLLIGAIAPALAGALLGALFNHDLVALAAFAGALATALLSLKVSWSSRQDLGTAAWLAGPLGVVLALGAALLARQSGADARWALAGAGVASAAVFARIWFDLWSTGISEALLMGLRARIPERTRLVADNGRGWRQVRTEAIEPGQEVVLGRGEVAPVDGVVRSGEAQALLHPAAGRSVPRGPGDPLLAGAYVVKGEVTLVATRVGPERALLRPGEFGQPHRELGARLAIFASRVTRWGGAAILLGVLTGLVLWPAGLASTLGAGAAILLALPMIAIRRASSTPYVLAAAIAAHRGIAIGSARLLDRAGRVATTIFCTRGTVTEGEPEVVEVQALNGGDERHLISLVAGAESAAAAEGHPIANAALRHCREQGLKPAAVRRAAFRPGLGVTAVSPGGAELVVGNRALLLAEGVSIAVADAGATRGEERGDTVVFVGLEGRIRAVVCLRDALRLGARAAVQRLIDLGLEVVLLSGDHRATVEAQARQLDISHVKAELLGPERVEGVCRLRDTGGLVAAIGLPVHDQPVLAAADVSIVLGAAGAEWEGAIALSGRDVRDASAALFLSRAARRVALRGTFGALAAAVLLGGLGGAGFLGPASAALLAFGVDLVALQLASRLRRRLERRLPTRG